MRLSRRRVRGVVDKELRDLRHNSNVVYTMLVLPLIFLVQPVVEVLTLSAHSAAVLRREHTLTYLLAIPTLVPAALAAYAIVGERLQGTLEPLLSTPVQRRELILGKALAVFLPSLAVAYAVFALFVVIVELFSAAGVAGALLRTPYVLAQVIFTPLLATWSIWLGMVISARFADPRAATQVAILVSLPTVAITSLIAFNVIPANLRVALGFGVGLLVLNRIGWRVATAVFDRERLITGSR